MDLKTSIRTLKLITNQNTSYKDLIEFFFNAPPLKDNNFLACADKSVIKNITTTDTRTRKKSAIKISVVIATYNRARLISGVICSLFAQIGIEKNSYEVIIVNDGSSDNTESVVKNFIENQKNAAAVITLINLSKNMGASVARNIGIIHASGEFIASTDDDCLVPSEWLCQFEKAFRENPEISAVGGHKEPIGTAGKPPSRYDLFMQWRRFPYMLRAKKSVALDPYNNCGDTANVCYKKTALIQAGGFNVFLGAWYDWELKVRLHVLGHSLLYRPEHVKHYAILNLKSYARMWMLLGWDGFLSGKLYPKVDTFDTSPSMAVRRIIADAQKALVAKKNRSDESVKSFSDIIIYAWLSTVCNISFCLGKYTVPIFISSFIAKLYGNKSKK